MSARRQIIAALSEDSTGGIATLADVARAEQLVDAYRAEILAELREATRRRKRVSHKAVAAQLRTQPGEWAPVGDYSSTSAAGIVHHIQNAYLVAYDPAGAFEARTELVDEGTRVHARYVGAAS